MCARSWGRERRNPACPKLVLSASSLPLPSPLWSLGVWAVSSLLIPPKGCEGGGTACGGLLIVTGGLAAAPCKCISQDVRVSGWGKEGIQDTVCKGHLQFRATYPTQRLFGGLPPNPSFEETCQPAPQGFWWIVLEACLKISIDVTCNLVIAFFLPLGWGKSQVPLGLWEGGGRGGDTRRFSKCPWKGDGIWLSGPSSGLP